MAASDLLGQISRLLALEQAGRALPEAAPGGFLADPDRGGAGLPPTDPMQVEAMIVGLLAGADEEVAAALAAATGREAAWLADEAERRGLRGGDRRPTSRYERG